MSAQLSTRAAVSEECSIARTALKRPETTPQSDESNSFSKQPQQFLKHTSPAACNSRLQCTTGKQTAICHSRMQ